VEWLAQLERERRAVAVPIGGERRYIAAEDAGRYRDALGIPPPPGLPAAFLEYAPDPLGELVARYARTHGPFQAQDVATRFGLGVGPVVAALGALEAVGRVVQGEFRPGGAGREWCDTGVLRALRQRSLARLRQEVEPVDQAALGRLYASWQGIGSGRRGPDALLEIIEQLQGAVLPASVLETQVLPARLERYDRREMDLLMASGQVLWVGHEPLGQQDGRVSLYLAEHAPFLAPSRPAGPDGEIHQPLREHLAARGASLFPQLLLAAGGGFAPEVVAALWDLVWAGEVTNDTLQPLRAFLNPRRGRERPTFGYRRRGAMLPTRTLTPPEAAGRWSLVSTLVYGEPTPTERLAARAQQLLERYGVLVREAVQAEGLEGGFSVVYGVLRTLEEAGRVRRGYFVAGCGALQFATPGAVDRLRTLREPGEAMQSVFLAATDPANPYGAARQWPERAEGRRPARAAGSWVILVDGALAAYIARGERDLLTFLDQVPEREPEAVAHEVARVLAAQVGPGRRQSLFVREVDGRPAHETLMAGALTGAGFRHGAQGYIKT
jgi:ATP-dependent helicase Lhr and Lhr-like helicase